MLSQTLRPKRFSEVAGQEENIRILKAIIKNPEEAPKSLIFSGEFGSGKTTCARIMARELNGITDDDYNINEAPFYYEYDSTVIGNVESIRNMRDSLMMGLGDYWKVTVLDECHSVSNAAQTALLKVLEEVGDRNIYIFCTTHPQKLLPTIRSRSLELSFDTVPEEDVKNNIKRVSELNDLSISDEVVDIIAQRSGGHMRNAHMLLDKYKLLGEKDFKDTVKSAIDLYCKFFISSARGDLEKMEYLLTELMRIPKDTLNADFYIVMTESMKKLCGLEVKYPIIGVMVDSFGRDIFSSIADMFFEPWMRVAFLDMPYFQAAMLKMGSMIKVIYDRKRSVSTVNSSSGGEGSTYIR